MKRLSSLLVLLIWGYTTIPTLWAADKIVVIVNKKSALVKLTPAEAKALFLGDTRFGAPGVLVELNERDRSSEIYKDFYAAIAAMSPKDVSVHWARKVFTGEAPPPVRLPGDDAAAIALVKTKPEAITYIYEKNANPSVKIIYSLGPNPGTARP